MQFSLDSLLCHYVVNVFLYLCYFIKWHSCCLPTVGGRYIQNKCSGQDINKFAQKTEAYSYLVWTGCSAGNSHIDMVYIRLPFEVLFRKTWHGDRWVFIRDRGAQIISIRCILSKLMVKSTQFEQNWAFFRKWYICW